MDNIVFICNDKPRQSLLFLDYFRPYLQLKLFNAGLKLELGKGIENDYRHLWNTATTIVGLCDLGDTFPVRNTSKLFLQQSEIKVKGIRGLGL